MSEHDEGGGNWVWPFVLGVIVGVLLMLGVGGVLITTQLTRARAEEERARMMEMMAREEAERARQEAERARAEAEARLKAEKDLVDAEKQKRMKKD
jgi:hypothetical protein